MLRLLRWLCPCFFGLTASVRADPLLPTIPNQTFYVTNYGAVADGTTTNTTAIQNAINAASAAGGGTVEITGPGTYLCGPIALKSSIALQVDGGALLQMLPRSSWVGTTSFIGATNLHDIEISGLGAIDGQGAAWWGPPVASSRPNFINITKTSKVLIQDITLQNPPTFHIMLKGNNTDVTIEGITINTPGNSPNTDGMDIASTNLLIKNCYISDGDDNLEIGGSGGPAAFITVTNCTFGTGHGVSIGSFTQGGVSNLTVINCTFNNTANGIRIKSDNDRGGLVQNLSYLNLSMTNVGFPIQIYEFYNTVGTPKNISPWDAATTLVGSSTSPTNPIYRNIIISNVTATATSGYPAGIIWGRTESPITNVVLSHIVLSGPEPFEIYNAVGVQFVDSQLSLPHGSNTFALYNAQLTVTNSGPATNVFAVGGLATNGFGNALQFYNAQGSVTQTNALGATPLTLSASTLTLTPGSYVLSNNLSAAAGCTVAVAGGTNALAGTLSGSGLLTLGLPASSTLELQGDCSGFTGTITQSLAGILRLDQGTNSWGAANAAFDTGASGILANRATADITIALGALSGGTGARLQGSDQPGPAVDSYSVGGLNSNSVFAGVVADGTSASVPHTVALTKTGAGTLTLTGTNTYSGVTTISAGTLQVGSGGSTGKLGTNNLVNNAALIFNRADALSYGGSISGVGSLLKLGAGTLTFTGTQVYSGTTTISAGTVALSGVASINSSTNITLGAGTLLDGSGASGGVQLASGQTLSGNGSVRGNVIVGNGATLSPGSSIGTLTFSNSLALSIGTTNLIEVSPSPLTNDLVNVVGSLQLAGTMIVTNIGASALAAGDTFRLLSAASYTGGFSKLVLPSLASGLSWNTNNLATNGTLQVVSTAPPVLGGIRQFGTNIVVSGAGGVANSNYYVLVSADVTLAPAQWLRLATNQFDASGNFTFTNAIDPSARQLFYRVQAP